MFLLYLFLYGGMYSQSVRLKGSWSDDMLWVGVQTRFRYLAITWLFCILGPVFSMLEKSERHLKQLLTPRQLKSSCALCSETVTSPLHDCNHLESLTWRQKPSSSTVCGVKRVFREICIISLHIIVAAWNEIWVFFCDAKPDGGDCSSW